MADGAQRQQDERELAAPRRSSAPVNDRVAKGSGTPWTVSGPRSLSRESAAKLRQLEWIKTANQGSACMSLSVAAAAFVAADDYVAGVLDSDVFPSRLFTQNTYSGGSLTEPPTSAAAGVNPSITAFPQVQSVSLVTAADAINDVAVGQVKLTLVPAAYDVVDASSPMDLVLSPNALVVIASDFYRVVSPPDQLTPTKTSR